jgi:MFS family permease
VLATFVIAGAAYAVFAFESSATARVFAIAGVALWSLVHAATNSIGKAMIAALVPRAQRGRAYGTYYLVFGLAWWAGSILLGALYDRNHLVTGVTATCALVAGAVVVMWSGWRVKSA